MLKGLFGSDKKKSEEEKIKQLEMALRAKDEAIRIRDHAIQIRDQEIQRLNNELVEESGRLDNMHILARSQSDDITSLTYSQMTLEAMVRHYRSEIEKMKEITDRGSLHANTENVVVDESLECQSNDIVEDLGIHLDNTWDTTI